MEKAVGKSIQKWVRQCAHLAPEKEIDFPLQGFGGRPFITGMSNAAYTTKVNAMMNDFRPVRGTRRNGAAVRAFFAVCEDMGYKGAKGRVVDIGTLIECNITLAAAEIIVRRAFEAGRARAAAEGR